MSIDHGKVLALADRVDDVCTRMTSKDGFLSPESDPRRLLWQIGDELREAAAAIAKLAESIDMVTAEHIGGCPFTGTPNSISSCACAWWLAHDAAQPAEAVEGDPWIDDAPLPEGYRVEEFVPRRWYWCTQDAAGAWISDGTYYGSYAATVVAAWRDHSETLKQGPTDAAQGAVAPFAYGADLTPGDYDMEHSVWLLRPGESVPAGCTPLYTHPQAAPAQGGVEMAKIGRLIETQDNRITEAPIFIVQQKRQHVSDADYDNDGIVWVNDDNQEAGSEDHARLEAAFLSNFNEEPKGWRRLAVRTEWEFVTACFTEQGCKDYLARDGHNLKEPRIYAAGSYRNEEWRSVRKFLMSLAAAPSQEGES